MIPYNLLLKPSLGTPLNRGHKLAEGLVLCPLFNEGVGSEVFDSSGNRGTGTLYGDTHFAPGKFGSALDFNGESDYGTVAAPVGSVLDLSVTHTLSIWLLARATDSRIPLCRYNWNTVEGGDLFIWLEDDTNISYSVRGSQPERIQAAFPGTNIWFHLVGTYDGVTESIYINGILANSKTISDVPVGNSEPWIIGADSDSTGGGGISNYWDGLIDNILIYNRALSASEIALLYKEPFCMFKDPAEIALLGAYEEEEPPVGNAAIMTTNAGFWGPTF